MEDILKIVDSTAVNQSDSYLVSYPHILTYFSEINVFGESEFIQSVHMVYGWMPRVLNLDIGSIDQGAQLLNRAKASGSISNKNLSELAKIVNNSFVGASKLLHFIDPENFAIWDSRVYSFVHGIKPYTYRVNDPATFQQYLSLLRSQVKRDAFNEFHIKVNKKVGYKVTAFRAIELIMFLNEKNNR